MIIVEMTGMGCINIRGKGLNQTGYESKIVWLSPRRWEARLHLNDNMIITQIPMITEFLLQWIREQMVDFGYASSIHPEVLPTMERIDAEMTAFELKNVKVAR